MIELERQVREVLHSVNWLLEAHDSFAELIDVNGSKVIVRCVGPCRTCKTDCVEVAFKESMPDINLVYYGGKSSKCGT